MGRIQVIHVAETIKGGIATYLRNVLPLQAARYGCQNIRVLIPAGQVDELSGTDVSILPFPEHRNRIVTALSAARALQAQLSVLHPAFVHIHSSFAGITCRPLLRLTPRRPWVVYCPHGWAFTRIGRTARTAAWVERRLSHVCDAIVCVSAAECDAALAARLSPSKLHVILNGLPDRSPPSVATMQRNAPLRLLFTGRFDRAKGFDVLVAALRRLHRTIEVDVFGESVLGENAIREVPSFVRLHGWQPFPVMEPFLRHCDALVMPSRWEGLPMSAIEAMRAGKAVIASRVGGLPELVEDGVTGCLVAPNDPVALAGTLERVQRNQLAAMGAVGRQRFLEKFRVEQCEAKLAKLYDELLVSSHMSTGPR